MNSSFDPSRIVVGIDGSAEGRAALAWAVDEATRRGTQLELVHAWRPIVRTMGGEGAEADAVVAARTHGNELLSAAYGQAQGSAPQLVLSKRLESGRPSAVLLDAASGARMLVVGSRGLGGYLGLRLGSVALHLVESAPCPTVVVRSRQRAKGPILVAVDGSSESKRVLAAAFEEAILRNSPLVVTSALYVHPAAEGVTDRDRAFAAVHAAVKMTVESLVNEFWQEHSNVEVRTTFPIGYPAEALAIASATAQLLIVGSHGGGGFAGMGLGSISHAVAHEAHCPVMVVREAAQPR
jgi:nucleotide-binding universal stress UspA family protein